MRDIKFRGYSEEHGWIYGYYTQDAEDRAYITEVSDGVDLSYEVDTKTIGQFTGLQDKNGRDIYEGDILEGEDALEKGTVIWELDGFFMHEVATDWKIFRPRVYHREAYIIGNIHDNPELLK